MSKVTVKVTLYNGEGCQMVVKIGNQTLQFHQSGSQSVELEPKNYIALIAGFLDPSATDPSVLIEFKQGTTLINSILIEEDHFIKPLKVNVN